MKAGIFSKEYPPEVYGGAGVHVAELTRFMRELIDVDVHCMGAPRDEPGVYAHGIDPALAEANAALQTLSTGLRMAHAASSIDVAHSHTWYSGWVVISPRGYMTSPMSLRHTLWSRIALGNATSSVAGTKFLPGQRKIPWNTPTQSSRCLPA